MNNEYIENFFYLVTVLSVLSVLSIILLIFLHLPEYIRTIRLKKIAKFYNLNFEKGYNLNITLLSSNIEITNLLKGKISGKNIEIYDKYNPQWKRIGRGYLGKKETILVVDGKESVLNTTASSYANLSKIKNILNDIKSDNTIKTSNIKYNNKITSSSYYSLIVVLIIIAILIKLFS